MLLLGWLQGESIVSECGGGGRWIWKEGGGRMEHSALGDRRKLTLWRPSRSRSSAGPSMRGGGRKLREGEIHQMRDTLCILHQRNEGTMGT